MFELVLRAPQALVEPLSDALIDEAEALSVSVEDADAGGQDEQPLFGEPGMPAPRAGWERSTLVVPISTGWPFSYRSPMSSATAMNLASSVL